MVQKNQKKNNIINQNKKIYNSYIKDKIYKFYLKKKNYNFNYKFDKNIGYLYKYNGYIKNKTKSLNIDFVFKNSFILKFINNLMKKGKKALAEKLIYKSLQILKINLIKKNTLNLLVKQQLIVLGKKYNLLYILYIFINIIKFIKIPFEVKNIRIGGKVYQVPFILSIEKQQNKAIKMIINVIKKNLNFKLNFVTEFEKLMLNRSIINRYVLDYYKLVYDNRSFAHYRWY